MKCPHCLKEFHHNFRTASLNYGHKDQMFEPGHGFLGIRFDRCPACKRSIVFLRTEQIMLNAGADIRPFEYMVYPKSVSRTPLPPEVPDEFAEDYREASLVLSDSPKASAALSRRCLQNVLKVAGMTTKKDLVQQIEEVLPTLPPHLRDLIDAIRVVGNFAAHPTKSAHTGEIIDVEPGEAELLLDVLEMAFDFYFVQPAEAQRRRDGINAKLAAAGKLPMKG